jgi:hypothetical protein
MLTLALAVPGSASAAPRSFFGMQAWTTPSNAELRQMADEGVGAFRTNLLWHGVEPRRGVRDWSGSDETVRSVVTAGLSVSPVLLGSPRFAARQETFPPRTAHGRRAWAEFVRDAVARYGPGGRFWRENPDVPVRPLRSWQVWNEPNFPPYWSGHPDVRQYVSFLRLTRQAVKARDPRATIVLAGLPEAVYRGRATRFPFIEGLYRIHGARRLFDVMALHPYSRNAARALRVVQRTRRIMDQHGDRRKPIWISEIGWATAGRSGDFILTSRRGQAAKLTATYRGLLRVRRRYRIGQVTWFSWRDRAPQPGEPNWWAINTGLFDRGGRPKPAWNAFVRVARR